MNCACESPNNSRSSPSMIVAVCYHQSMRLFRYTPARHIRAFSSSHASGARGLCLALCLVFGLFAAGCYERVVRSEGLGAREPEVHEPALEQERTIVDDLEDAVMGSRPRGNGPR